MGRYHAGSTGLCFRDRAWVKIGASAHASSPSISRSVKPVSTDTLDAVTIRVAPNHVVAGRAAGHTTRDAIDGEGRIVDVRRRVHPQRYRLAPRAVARHSRPHAAKEACDRFPIEPHPGSRAPLQRKTLTFASRARSRPRGPGVAASVLVAPVFWE